MNATSATPLPKADPTHRASNVPRCEYALLGLASVVILAVTSAGSILITLPEALEAVSTPAFGAPWLMPSRDAAAQACGA